MTNLTTHSLGAVLLMGVCVIAPRIQQWCAPGQVCPPPQVEYIYVPAQQMQPQLSWGSQPFRVSGNLWNYNTPVVADPVVYQTVEVTTQETPAAPIVIEKQIAPQVVPQAMAEITEYVPQKTVEYVEREVTRLVPQTTTETVPVEKIEYVEQKRTVPLNATQGWGQTTTRAYGCVGGLVARSYGCVGGLATGSYSYYSPTSMFARNNFCETRNYSDSSVRYVTSPHSGDMKMHDSHGMGMHGSHGMGMHDSHGASAWYLGRGVRNFFSNRRAARNQRLMSRAQDCH